MSEDVKATLFGIAFTAILFIPFPIVLLWLMNRRGVVGTIVRGAMAAFTMLVGVAFICLAIYFSIESVLSARYLIALGLLLVAFQSSVLFRFGWSWLTDAGPGIEHFTLDFDDPRAIAAKELAQSRISELIEALPAQPHIKPRVLISRPQQWPEAEEDEDEDFDWAIPMEYAAGMFLVVSEDPCINPDCKTARVPQDEIIDWGIHDTVHDTVHGSFLAIATFQEFERKKKRLNRTMQTELKRLVDYS